LSRHELIGEAALLYAAELRSLLDQVSGLLDAQPLPMEGGTWDGYMLAEQARRLLQDEPTAAGHALRDELHSARIVARAAAALVAARQEGDDARTRMCEQVLYRAVAAYKTQNPWVSSRSGWSMAEDSR
jgi:hypothetical protein